MSFHVFKIFVLLLFVSAISITCFLTWGQTSNSHRATRFMNKHRGNRSSLENHFTVLDKGENATLVTEPKPKPETPMPLLYKKMFEKAPVWDFDDVYNQDVPPRPATCAQSLRNSKDEFFMKAFLPNVCLFLHKDSINMSEWNRLSHFNNPFGFMEYKYEDVIPVLKLIPKPKEPLLSTKPGSNGCVHCAVVGTGGILNGSKMGAEIDAHDYVFRMNGAITEGYEEDVGKRTSVYVHSAHSIIKSPVLFKEYGYKSAPHDKGIKYVMMPERLKDIQWLEGLLKGKRVAAGPFRKKTPRLYYSGQYKKTRFYVLHQDFLRYIRNRFLSSPKLKTKYWSTIRPTNGAFTIFLALHTCDTASSHHFLFNTDLITKYYF
ncbi:alpha-N-acetylgalactosaminide alpha-2,6-sialyltransferase 1-like [Salarias fasciatus]|uniref:alpha-N-acetylgalactosaminide alpha-2,6-sialyltransferase 1-like n=1 Tax=Salarias fasciatus TaxID=181472 RepID=UPI001176DF61|nr:alpha-N-acetylgalactosaminide alpha-2,6-sialyltransferase 1-like [Salarias fasciatus]